MVNKKKESFIIEFFRVLTDREHPMFLLGNSSCPCGELLLAGIKIETHCWRSICKYNHPYSCVHISQDPDTSYSKNELKQIAKMFADYIEKAYMTGCAIKVIIPK